jgi:hypothetical protein
MSQADTLNGSWGWALAHPDAFAVGEVIEEGINSLERPLDLEYRGTDTDLLR